MTSEFRSHFLHQAGNLLHRAGCGCKATKWQSINSSNTILSNGRAKHGVVVPRGMRLRSNKMAVIAQIK